VSGGHFGYYNLALEYQGYNIIDLEPNDGEVSCHRFLRFLRLGISDFGTFTSLRQRSSNAL